MFSWRAFPDVTPGAYLTVPALRASGIDVAFTTRLGGFSDGAFASLNLSYVSGDDPGTVSRNRARALQAIGVAPDRWTSGRQVHGTTVARVTTTERGMGATDPASVVPDTDALWTSEADTALAVLVADCVPIVLADPERRRIGVVHAGWRGLVAGIVERAVSEIEPARTLEAYVGPAIGPCCYEVGADVTEPARAALGDGVVRSKGAMRLDLWLGAQIALRTAGVQRIHLAALCTRCEPHRFFSHRAGDSGRQGVLAVMRA
ncbi:MAG TPA: peptidoglycan editing factor PgeF [Actinomycetota bacterium]|nr:peptidoglycan editing factor PgeF [Actinomycetota bacterium]